MWCVVMFDLPTNTKDQRRAASLFRNKLLDAGYSMIQFSVYAKYSPTLANNRQTVQFVKKELPDYGEVRILHITDRQWSMMQRFYGRTPKKTEQKPEELALF
ncbi:CRISPR-associated protein Cas2 [Bifidobacterium bombi DSM 19703]|uniref:CRISPR-associated endoribonuclease Cas2 n=1 Tax=Bifidobacterium bombi DSM 19703 TaxID=1341695 RepID=A0A080N2Y8_9BIFI|nr:CRISPR-associated protein Cas2 [Bifidobacterium bombi DSM 19703]